MTKEPRHICTDDGWCDALRERLEMENSNKKGMTPLRLTNTKTWESRTVGVAYRMSAKDRGLLFNFCPYCGSYILTAEKGDHVIPCPADFPPKETP